MKLVEDYSDRCEIWDLNLKVVIDFRTSEDTKTYFIQEWIDGIGGASSEVLEIETHQFINVDDVLHRQSWRLNVTAYLTVEQVDWIHDCRRKNEAFHASYVNPNLVPDAQVWRRVRSLLRKRGDDSRLFEMTCDDGSMGFDVCLSIEARELGCMAPDEFLVSEAVQYSEEFPNRVSSKLTAKLDEFSGDARMAV